MKSKKERLKEQSLKQIERKKESEKQEQELKEKARSKEGLSLSAVKSLKKEPVFCLVIKLLAAGVYMYSCFFYGGVTVIGILGGYIEDIEKKYAVFMLIGVILLLAALILMFFKKYAVSAALNVIGTILYMKTAVFLVETIRKRLNENYVTDPELLNLDKVYVRRYYPELAFLGLGIVLLLISLVRRYLRYRRLRAEHDNAPVKSIIDD